jgi:hypothetical protein
VSETLEFLIAHEVQGRLVNQRGGVQGVCRGLCRHPRRGEHPQFVVDEREQVISNSRAPQTAVHPTVYAFSSAAIIRCALW